MMQPPPNNPDNTSPQSAELFNLLTENIEGYACFTTDAEGRINGWNAGAERLLGYPEKKIIGESIGALLTPDEWAKNLSAQELETAFEHGRLESKKVLQRQNGSRFQARETILPLKNEDDSIRGYALIIREESLVENLSSQKSQPEAKESTLTSQETVDKLSGNLQNLITRKDGFAQANENDGQANLSAQNILESITDGFYTLDRNSNFTFVNRQAERIMHKTREELLGKNIWEIFPDAVNTAFYRQYGKAMAEQKAVVFEEFYEPLDLRVELRAYPSPDGLSVYFHDISERWRAENALRRSEEKYRSLFESIDEGFCIIEMIFDANDKPVDYRFLEINPSFGQLTGIDAEAALKSMSVRQLVPNLEEKWFDIYGRVAQTGESIRFTEGSDVMERWFDVYAFRIGKPEERKVAIIFNNVSQSRIVENALRESQQKLKTALDAGRMGSWELDLATNELIASDSCKTNYGYAPGDEFTYQNLADSIHPDDAARWREIVSDAIEDCTNFEIEYRTIWTDKTIHWVLVRGNCYADKSGKTVSLAGVSIDITERKLIEEALSDTKKRFEATLTAGEIGTWTWDVINDRVYADKNLAGMFSVSEEAASGGAIENYVSAMHEDDRERVGAIIDQAVESGDYYETEYRLVQQDGSLRTVIARGNVERDAEGKAVNLPGVVVDITERKQAEEALRESEAHFSTALTVAKLGTFEWSLKNDAVKLDQRSREIFGFNEWEGITASEVFDRIDQADIERILAEVKQSQASKTPLETEYQINLPDGATRTVVSTNEVVIGADGEVERQFGVFNDITSRKRREKNLAFLADLQKDLAGSLSVEDILKVAGAQVAGYFSLTHCLFVKISGEAETANVFYDYRAEGASDLVGSYPISHFHTVEERERLSTGKAIFVDDVRRHSAQAADNFEDLGIRALATAPYVSNGRWKFALSVQYDAPHNWRDDEKTLLSELAERIYLRIERAASEDSLRESEARFRALQQATPDGFMLFESVRDEGGVISDFRWVYVNPSAERIIGRGQADLLGKLLCVEMPGNRIQRLFEKYVEVVETGEVWHREFSYNFENLDHDFISTAVRVGDGFAVGFSDITERKKSEDALRRSEEQYRTLFESIDEGFCVIEMIFDENGKALDYIYLELNPAFEKHSGLVNAKGRRLREFVPDYEDFWFDTYGRVATTGESVRFDSYSEAFDRWFDVYAFRPGDHDQKKVAIIFNDITERKKSEEAVRRSEEKYRSLFTSIAAGFCVIEVIFDEIGRPYDYLFLEVNPAFTRQTGLTDAIGKTANKLAPGLEQFWFDKYGEVAVTGESLRFEHRADALNRWYDVYAFRVGEPEEKRVAVLFNDISESKLAELNVREAEERYRALVNATATTVWHATPEGALSFVGDTWTDVSGQSTDEILKWGWLEALHPEDRDQTIEKWKKSLEGKTVYSTDFRILTKEGHYKWYAANAVPVFDSEGNLREWIGTNTDIHAKRQAEEDRKQVEHEREQLLRSEREARLAADNANRLKDEFLATLSHELRTPLNAILGWSQMMKGSAMGESEREKALEVIERNARAQNQLIDDLLDVSRIITGKLRLDVRAVDLQSVIAAATDAAKPGGDAKGIRLQTLIDPQAGPISGDPERLQQVVWNLLSNAIKFTPKGGRIQIRLERINSHIEIIVSDTGKGIEAEFLPYVFDRFRQSDGSMTRRHGGLGLGLAIVQQIVELHGGTVVVDSEGEDRGSTFTVALPLLPVRREPASDVPRVHPAANTDVPSIDCPAELAGLRVLLVEDEVDSRDLIRLLLSTCGAEVKAASSAAEAFDLIKAEKFDVIISDIGMPDEDGFTLIGKIRNLPGEQGGDTPAIALTAYARAEDRVQALRSGFQMHISKPVEPDELTVAVANLAGLRRNTNQ